MHLVAHQNRQQALLSREAPSSARGKQGESYSGPPLAETAELVPPASEPRQVLINGTTSEGTIRRLQLPMIHCTGGPSNGRLALFPGNPEESMKIGSMMVFVTAVEPFIHAGLEEGQRAQTSEAKAEPIPKPAASSGSTLYAIASQDPKRLAIEDFAVYALESDRGVPRLAFEGTVNPAEYGRFLKLAPPDTTADQPAELTDFINIETAAKGIRRLKVYPTRCVGGPADGKPFPLLVNPTVLQESGLITVAVTALEFRPKEIGFSLRQTQYRTNFVGQLSLYALEELREPPNRFGRHAGFQLKYVASLDAESYLKLQNHKAQSP